MIARGGNTLTYRMIKLMLILMPLHSFIFNLLTSSKIIILWRDVLAFAIFIYLGFLHRFKIKIDRISMYILLSWFFGLVHAIIFHDNNMPIEIWLNTYRVYFMPSFIYIIIRNVNLTKKQLSNLKIIYLYEALIICIFGIIQQLIFSKAFTSFMGYRRESISFAYGIQRNIGFYESANIMAVYLLFAIIICIDLLKERKKRINTYILVVLIVGFVLTFSFSSYIAFLVVLLVRVILNNNNTSHIIIDIMKGLFFVSLGILGILVIDRFLFKSLIYVQIMKRMDELFIAIKSKELYELTTNSVADHILSITEPINVLSKNFLGIGFSTETFMVLGKVDHLKYAVESSIFTILYDFGIITGMLYMFPYFQVFRLNHKKNTEYKQIKLIGVGLLVVFITLPIVQSYELRFFFFLLYGVIISESKLNEKPNPPAMLGRIG